MMRYSKYCKIINFVKTRSIYSNCRKDKEDDDVLTTHQNFKLQSWKRQITNFVNLSSTKEKKDGKVFSKKKFWIFSKNAWVSNTIFQSGYSSGVLDKSQERRLPHSVWKRLICNFFNFDIFHQFLSFLDWPFKNSRKLTIELLSIKM